MGLLCPAATALAAEVDAKTIVFFGDSLTAGFGVDPDEAYPALIRKKLADAGLTHAVVNAGLSGETSAGGLRRVDWILRRRPDVFVLALGGNDGLRGIPPETTRANLQAIIDRVRSKHPDSKIVLAGMRAPPNMGADFTRAFAAIYPELARKNDVALIPFLLEGVAGRAGLNQGDGIHPNPKGYAKIAETVWNILKDFL